MEKLEIFSNEEFGEVRTIIVNEEVYFCGVDVCRALGYEKPRNAISQHCRHDALKQGVTDSLGRTQETKFIHQNDVLRLIVKSKLPAAEKFESWVFDEVVPSVLKHGAYATEATIEKIVSDPDYFIGLLTNLKQEQEKRKEAELIAEQRRREVVYKQKVIEEQKPKVEFYECAIDKESTYTTTEIAKSLGLRTAHQLSLFLKEKGIVYRQGKRWILTAKYAEQGYQKIRAYTSCEYGTLVWTLKGYEFIKKLYEEENGEVC